MKTAWVLLNTWAYGLPTRRRWVIWAVVALLAVLVSGALPFPWSWIATLPFVGFGYVLFDSHARRQRDDDSRRA